MIAAVLRTTAAAAILIWITWESIHAGASYCSSCSTCSQESICVKK